MNTSCVFFLAIVAVIFSAEVIFERCEVYDVNPKFLTNVSLIVKRNSRRSPYFVHASGRLLQTLGDNVTINIVLYEFLHNEYKRSFVEMTMKMCDVIHKEPWKSIVGTVFVAHGGLCPAPPKFYNFANLTMDINKFPSLLPFERFMGQGYGIFTPTQEIIASGRLYMRYNRDLPKGK